MRPWEIHPALVHFPLALLLTAVAVDLYAAIRRRDDLAPAATKLMIGGLLTGVFAAAAGALAYATVPAHTPRAHVLMYWHLALAVAALVVFGSVTYLRWRRPQISLAMRGVGLIGALLISAAGYLGGSLVLRGGAGVDPALLAPAVRAAHTHHEAHEQHHH